jgi:aldose 1-epimerase
MVEEFGRTPDGEAVGRVRIKGGGVSAAIITWGASLQDLRLEGHAAPLILGFPDFQTYLDYPRYFGAIVGRFANRIAGGRFTIDGHTFQADADFLGKHTLHGGAKGFAKRNWTIDDSGPDFVRLSYLSPDGEMGFPGNLKASATYRMTGEGRMTIEMEAETDAPTLCNLSQHAYFNLDDGGATPVTDHSLRIAADHYLPVDAEMIPTGEVADVTGTRFDFREMHPIRNHADNGSHAFYDHNYCVERDKTPLRPILTLKGARSGVTMEMRATEPGLQFYDGVAIPENLPGLDGITYQPFSALCLEPQMWPDAPNQPGFPSALLRPGERYGNVIEYRFSVIR